MRDPYEVLGVRPGSGPAEWKRAYRRLAMRWHPDRSEHPEATERFKEINAAYEQLLAVDPSPAAETAPHEASAEAASAEAPGEAAVPQAADIRLNFELSLEEAAAGARKTISYHRRQHCATCDGTGEAGLTRTRFCSHCHGSGRVRSGPGGLEACADCQGRGFFSERICPECQGSGRTSREVSLQITVPPGVLPGDELRLAGQGEIGDAGLADGDLYLTLVLQRHPLFSLRGRDLCYRMPVSAIALLGGAEIELPGLDGVVRHVLSAGTPEARQVRIEGRGFPGRGRSAGGDLCVDLEPVWPGRLDARQRKLLLQLEAALQTDCAASLPEVAAWRERHAGHRP